MLNKVDLTNGKVIVKELTSNGARFLNIRDFIDSLSIDELIKYDIGLGAASSRTKKQKLLAQIYTNKILERIKTPFITSDASISDTTKKGGFGIIAVNKQKTDIIYSYKQKIDTDDAQKGELAGVESSLNLINQNIFPNEKRIAILCDCKNVIKYITNTN
ncbi:MAG: hypothetical protein GY938_14225, partial [Ketobacter sp.]|nr:hypothetical protein [Ketobacter sp.]